MVDRGEHNKLGPMLERQHVPARLAPPGFLEARTVVGTLRPPADWYCSAYAHSPNAGPWVHWGNGDTSFESVLYGMTHPWELKNYEALNGDIHGPHNCRHMMQYYRKGFWTYHVNWWYRSNCGTWLVDHLINTDDLMPSWAKIMDNVRGRVVNNSPRAKPQLTKEMRSWIEEADGELASQLYQGRKPIHPLFIQP